MDLRFPDAEPTSEERDAVDRVLGAPTSRWEGGARDAAHEAHVAEGGHAARARRHLLLPVLHAVQGRVGWISPGALGYVCRRLSVPPADAWGVATFYGLLATTPRPRRVLHVCDDIACRRRGAGALIQTLNETAGDGWLPSPCLGLCDQAPAALLTNAGDPPVEQALTALTPDRALAAIRHGATPVPPPSPPLPQRGAPKLRLLRRIGAVDPTSLTAYRDSGGYQALRRAFDLGAEGVIREVTRSNLLGRGGAAFPTGRKWDAVAKQAAYPHYVICNADESEPGTFKDRVLLEGDPFAIVEAMTIAGFAVGAEQGFLYLRAEYPLAHERMGHALREARAHGLLGDDILGAGVRFDIEIRKGAGAYICGEETAIFNSIEGYRGEPRNKPPFPVESGLFRRPTLVNNVETLANIPWIVLEGGAAFAAIGTKESTGTRLFCLSGDVVRPGVYEIPFGATLLDLLALAGGASTPAIAAILLGGAAGGFVPRPDGITLSFEGAREGGATLGSGVVMVFGDTRDLPDTVRRIAAFFRDESCGQCVPCRVGTVRQEEVLARLAAGTPRGSVAEELALLDEIGRAMKDASICGLGQTAYGAVETAVKRLALYGEGAPR